MSITVKAIVTAMTALIFAGILKGKNGSAAFSVAVAAVVAIIIGILPQLREIYVVWIGLTGKTGLDKSFFTPLIKTVGIAAACRTASDLCKDNGEKALGTQIELAGAAAGMICSVPLIEKILDLIGAL